MKLDDKRMLSSMISTVQMGQIGIRSVLNSNISAKMKLALSDQLREYDSLERQIQELALKHEYKLNNVNPVVRRLAEKTTKVRLSVGNVPSKVAGMMIQGNTRGMILSIKNQHKHAVNDTAVSELSNKLLSIEESNIKQMQAFL